MAKFEECPHCGLRSLVPTIRRWHGDNCPKVTGRLTRRERQRLEREGKDPSVRGPNQNHPMRDRDNEIAQILYSEGLTDEVLTYKQVRQIYNSAMKKLRSMFDENNDNRPIPPDKKS